MPIRQEPFYLPLEDGPRFCIWREPAHREMRGAIVHAPAFAEEMNKCRPMTARAARRLAEAGFGVLDIDLKGCGDSSGDFGEATWDRWIADVRSAIAHAESRTRGPLRIWGTRVGALLACAAAEGLESPSFLLWQPVTSGHAFMTRFLRLKLAAGLASPNEASSGTAALRRTLDAGAAIDIAGYRIEPGLAHGLDHARLAFPSGTSSILWLDVVGSASPSLGAASATAVKALEAAGLPVTTHAVPGAAFWQTVEIAMCDSLVDLTVDLVDRATPDARS